MGVRGASPFNGSGTAVPFNGSGTAVPFNGSGTAAPFNGCGPAALAPHPKWIRWLGCAARARGAPAAEGASPLAIGKANAPAPEVSAYGVLYISE